MTTPDIQITRIGGQAPVQAEGMINGHFFYFYARWDGWSFAIALDPDVDVYGMSSPQGGFYREDTFGDPGGYDASYMSGSVVEKIIRDCAQQFILAYPEPPNVDTALQQVPNLTGLWQGITQDYATPSHLWKITQQGRFLNILARWEAGNSALWVPWLGKLSPNTHSFELHSLTRAFTASILDRDHFILSQWFGRYEPSSLPEYSEVINPRQTPTIRYDVIFSRGEDAVSDETR
jgi:hypothetical protein